MTADKKNRDYGIIYIHKSVIKNCSGSSFKQTIVAALNSTEIVNKTTAHASIVFGRVFLFEKLDQVRFWDFEDDTY